MIDKEPFVYNIAQVFKDGKPVGTIQREPFPLGGYVYFAETNHGQRIYCGNVCAEALAAFA